ncbi:hypothetical protein GCM10007416_13890 [Kroppenstedtia guangzhouensis]|uniref:Uncharacterized protein n=1 Tax=Kroppenstedtia guangzhouensis TaxID=1274356 RepID=A0ABQ1GEJ3_9BACL|nr:hypothetical protein GCM10007416_13890 [Kroppenstedtia guangzhouensis]
MREILTIGLRLFRIEAEKNPNGGVTREQGGLVSKGRSSERDEVVPVDEETRDDGL